MTDDAQPKGLTFPCTFPIKVMGKPDAALESFVKKTLKDTIKNPKSIKLETRHSKYQNYISITATFTAESKKELDQLYQLISSHPDVKVTL